MANKREKKTFSVKSFITEKVILSSDQDGVPEGGQPDVPDVGQGPGVPLREVREGWGHLHPQGQAH